MDYKPLPSIKAAESADQPSLLRWLNRLPDLIPGIQTFSVSFDPASVPANSESVQTIAIAGVGYTDIIIINKPTNTAGLDLVHSWASAANQVSVKFRNTTGSPIDPGTETYRVMAVSL